MNHQVSFLGCECPLAQQTQFQDEIEMNSWRVCGVLKELCRTLSPVESYFFLVELLLHGKDPMEFLYVAFQECLLCKIATNGFAAC